MARKMMRLMNTAWFLVLGAALTQPHAFAAPAQLVPEPARITSTATLAPMLGVTKAGQRWVAVGDYGIVLLSDDEGRTFRQARTPVSSGLTAVSFADDKNGWAVGHWGMILNTTDGGENWAIQRQDTAEDRPLFSVHFFDAREGIAVGLWSLFLHTQDGGKTWTPKELPKPPDGSKADRNLFRIFASKKGALFITAERGMVLRSMDRGQTWQYLNTGYTGSLWSGVALKDETLLVAGLRGTIYRSTDNGHSWQAINSGSKSSVTDLVETAEGVVGVALDGVTLESRDGGASFTWSQRDDRVSLNAVQFAEKNREVVRFSRRGVLPPEPR